MGRTDNSVALRLVNFAACDPYILNSGRTGMQSGAKTCRPVWDKYCNDHARLFMKAEEIKARMKRVSIETMLELKPEDFIGREREAVIRQRVDQRAFRQMVLGNYEGCCAITGIDIPELLVASHIKPWSVDKENRLNPANGICLSALYDRLFDSGLIGIREDLTVELSGDLKEQCTKDYFESHFKWLENHELNTPIEHRPDPVFLQYHYENIFSRHCS